MKILYILNSANIFGGSTKSFLRYFHPLIENHDDIEAIICASHEMKEWSANHKKKIKYYKVNPKFYTYPSTHSFKDTLQFIPKLIAKTIANYIEYRKIVKIARKERVDIIHTNVSVINIGYLAAKKLNIPHVYHLREFQTSDFGMKIIPSFSKFTQRLQVNWNYNICITKAIQQHYGLNDNNSKVIYNGVKSLKYTPTTKEKQPYFLFVGRLEESKGIEDVIEAFGKATTANSSYNLLIAGDTNDFTYKEKLHNLSKATGKSERIKFLGNRQDVEQLMQQATAIIIASKREAFGLITAEAAFNRCLIIGKYTGGTKEQINNGVAVCGIKSGIEYNTLEEMRTILGDVAERPNDYTEIVDSAYKTALKLYSIESFVNSIYHYYLSIYEQGQNN